MIKREKSIHPTFCFGISRHNVIIPLKVVNIEELEGGWFQYYFEINYPKPTDYMKKHYRSDFKSKTVTEDLPLCDEFTNIRLTLAGAKELITKTMIVNRAAAMMTVNNIDKKIAEIDDIIAEIELTINNKDLSRLVELEDESKS
jgi:hypothetical protein